VGATYTFSGGTGNYASAAAQTKYNNTNLATPSFKIRVKGSSFKGPGSYDRVTLLEMPDRDGFDIALFQGDPGVYVLTTNQTTNGRKYHDLGFVPDDSLWYVIYVQVCATANGGRYMAIADASGTVIETSSEEINVDLGGTTGAFSVGPTFGGDTIIVDGVAIYDTYLTGSARFSTPTTGDSGIVGLYKFDEGTGTSVADATGGTSLTISGSGTWNTSDGSWDAGGGSSVPIAAISSGYSQRGLR